MSAPNPDGARARPTFRPARAEDARFLAELAAEAFGVYGDYQPIVAAWAADPYVEATLLEQDGAPAGAAFLVFLKPGEAPDTKVGDLLALAVAAPFRGRGLGAALLAHVIGRAHDVARRHGIGALRLAVAEGNAHARRLFESAGFRYYEALGSYPRGQTALHMSLPLARRGSRGRLL
jgi:ribosomal protein S18 acetylase RimI-like enzyme